MSVSTGPGENGASPRYFGTDGIRGRYGVVPITEDFFYALGRATAFLFKRQGKICVGRDTRCSSAALESALEAGLCAAGLEVWKLGVASTPMVACLAHSLDTGGAVISASHNPYTDNGVKFFGAGGCKLSRQEELAIEKKLALPAERATGSGKTRILEDGLERYLAHCRGLFPNLRLDGLRLVVDCAHGATYESAPRLLKTLGARLWSLGISPNGRNINDACGSLQPRVLREQVRKKRAALGIAFDGDGDRVVLVAADGTLLDGDDLLYLLASQLRERLNGALVGTVMSNMALERAVRALGLNFHRVPVGDRHILECLQRKGLKLGGEGSGHIVHLDYATTGDGLLTALLLLDCLFASGHREFEGILRSTPHKCPQRLLNLPWPRDLDPFSLPGLKAAVRTAEHRLDGAGRVLLRRSGTEPLLRVLVEGEKSALVRELADSITAVAHRLAATSENRRMTLPRAQSTPGKASAPDHPK